jgi:hypothetical protein
MHHDSSDTHDIGGFLDTFERIEQESFAETFSLLTDING